MMMMMSLHKKVERRPPPPPPNLNDVLLLLLLPPSIGREGGALLLPVVPAVAVLMVTKENQKSSLSLSLSLLFFVCLFSPSFFCCFLLCLPLNTCKKEESLARPHTNEESQVRLTGVLCCALKEFSNSMCVDIPKKKKANGGT